MRIVDLRVEIGKEIESFNANNIKINDLTKDLMMSLSCSGFNTRYPNGKIELLKSIRADVKRQRKLYKTSSTNGSSNVWPSLIIVQNYGYGIYGKEESK